jgi:hypothetical protein
MKITLTGADERTDLRAIRDFAKRHPEVEFSFLYSETPENRNRYPSVDYLIDAAMSVGAISAVHVCGTRARLHLLEGDHLWIWKFQRIQVNGLVAPHDLKRICEALSARQVITQLRPGASASSFHANHTYLVDASGGRGILPEKWEKPDTWKNVGYAGGLTPENLGTEIPRILAADPRAAWIDMETSLRVDDWFSLERCEAALTAFKVALARG